MMKKYSDHVLGDTVEAVLKAFYSHPGAMDKKPFGFDVHQAFEFFLNGDGKLYRKEPGAMVPLTLAQEVELHDNVAAGAVEFYLRRPTAGLPPYPQTDKAILHAATGRQIPVE